MSKILDKLADQHEQRIIDVLYRLEEDVIKEVTRAAENMRFQDALDGITGRTFPTVDRLYSSEDQIEGARAFAEKRKPVWRGR